MTIDLLVRYLHFLGLFIWIGTLAAEWALLRPELPRRTLQKLLRIDRVYGVSAVLVVGTGLLLWFAVGKPAEFYTSNGIFHLKVTLAVLVGILSIYPSIFFARERKGNADERLVIPKRLLKLVRLQLILMAIIPLLATLMAAGVKM